MVSCDRQSQTQQISSLRDISLTCLKDIPFFKKDHEDAYKHTYEVLDISGFFNFPNVMRDAIMLIILPITLKDVAKTWLKSLPSGIITIWSKIKEQFIQQFSPPSKISKLKKNILNFQQLDGESLYEAWE